MTRLQAFILLGIVAFAAFHHWGPWDAAAFTATVWLLSPHGPRLG